MNNRLKSGRSINKQEKVLFSMLPVGVQSQKALSLFYLEDTISKRVADQKRSKAELKKKSAINTLEVVIRARGRKYTIKYETLCYWGLRYLLSKRTTKGIDALTGWMADMVTPTSSLDELTQEERDMVIQTQSAEMKPFDCLSSDKLEKVLQIQEARAFFQIVTQLPALQICFNDRRICYELDLRAKGFKRFSNTDDIVGTMIHTILHTHVNKWNRPVKASWTGVQYIDAIDILADDSAEWGDNYPVGMLLDEHQNLTAVYITAKHGLRSDSSINRMTGEGPVEQVCKVIGMEGVDVYQNLIVKRKSSGKCIILCRNPEEFEHTITDVYELRIGNKKELRTYFGNEAYLLPFPRTLQEKEYVSRLFKRIIYEESRQLWEEVLAKAIGVERPADANRSANIFCYNGKSLINGTLFRVKDITQCRTDPKGSSQIVCWPWQAEYLRAVLSDDITIFTIENSETEGKLLKLYTGGSINDVHMRGATAK